jgi:alpha-glucosidase
MYDAMRFWLDRGVDGFRVDVIYHLIEDEALRDEPPNPGWHEGMRDIERTLRTHTIDQPGTHEIVEEMRRVIDAYEDRLLIGEIYLPLGQLVAYYGRGGTEGVHLPFNFQLIGADWNAEHLAGLIAEYEAALPKEGWPNWVLSNHDQPRIAGRVGERQARVAAMMLLTLRGTPTLYYGDELGIGEVEIPEERIQDPQAQNEPGRAFNRDSSRTPMPWSDAAYGDFSKEMPWLPLNKDWSTRNVATQKADQSSMLLLYQRLLKLRREEVALRTGGYRELAVKDGVLAYERGEGAGRLGVALNLKGEAQEISLPKAYEGAAVLLSTCEDASATASAPLVLQPDEGVILRPRTEGDAL